MRSMIGAAFFFSLAATTVAQEKDVDVATLAALQKLETRVFAPESADAKLRSDSLKALRDGVNQRDVAAWRQIKTREAWEKARDERIARLRASLGTFPEVPKEVKVVVTKKIPGNGFTIECLLYETRPNFFVSANLYVPEKTDRPMPGFMIIHSHHNPKTERELQDMGMMWARQGCLVLIPDMLGHGERRQHPFTDAKTFPEAFKVGRQDYYFRYNVNLHLSLVGESLMGWMIWDLMRGLDMLFQRPGLDKSKIMVFGSVAGGGDPCAVLAALDSRVTAAAPFNFGGPQPETKLAGKDDPELAFNYMGGGSWESTRGLKLSARDGFQAWMIVGSIAPRGLIYAHEFAWDDQRDPVWARFNKIWGEFYGARDKLASAKGRGSVTGRPPESTHCNNIGAEHRKPIYPTLTRWFGLPIPEENEKRFDSIDLRCWTDDARKSLQPKSARELALEMAKAKGAGRVGTERAKWASLLGIPEVEPPGQPNVEIEGMGTVGTGQGSPVVMEKIVLRRGGAARTALPAVLIRPMGKAAPTRVVIGIAQEGKEGFLKHRAETIARLLKQDIAVCLPDLRGTGETASDGRGRTSGATSYSASLLLHGQTVAGTQLQELRLLMAALGKRGFTAISLWGDSFSEPNDPRQSFAVPLDAGKFPRQSEPMGGLLALLGGVFGGDEVKAIYVRGGLVSFRSMLESPFCYFPHDAVIPGVLPVAEMETLALANAKRGLRLEGLVDGLNRRVDEKTLEKAYRAARFSRPAHNLMVLRGNPADPMEVANWFAAQMRK